MEQALYISRIEKLTYFTDDFSRLYFGQEFCERLMPSEKQLGQAISFARNNGIGFTFVTPYVTNRGLERLEDLIGYVGRHAPESEIVFNDWGVFQFLHLEARGLTPVLGRLLNKTKRGPRIMHIIDKVPEETRAFYQGSNLDVPEACRFLRRQGIFRVEYDNALQGTRFAGTPGDIHKSLYMPYAFVSSSRFCLTACCDDPEQSDYVGIIPCGRECRSYTFTLFNPVMGLPLIRRGNTVFFLNERIPDSVSNGDVDRIVIQPEIPV